MSTKSTKAIIFDLGGVIINIDYNRTANAFQNMGLQNFNTMFSQAQQSHLFDRLETGDIAPQAFRDEVRKLANAQWTDIEIDNAWNAMLLDIPSQRIDFLRDIARQHPIYLLSNTNIIHLECFSAYVNNTYGLARLDPLFTKAYYSHEIRQRKPHVETFEWVLQDANLDPANTLFFDDSPQHLEGATAAGIEAHLVPKGAEIAELVKAAIGN